MFSDEFICFAGKRDSMYTKYKEEMSSLLVTPEWVNQQIQSGLKKQKIVDVCLHLPMMKRDAQKEYDDGHLPEAVFFDQSVCFNKTPYDLMIPTKEQFEEYVGGLGIDASTHVIMYDSNAMFGLFSSQRAWWLFRAYGHKKISILNGGLPRWKNENFTLTTEVKPITPVKYVATFTPDIYKTFEQMEENLSKKEYTVVDARPPPRFHGKAPELVAGQ